jgi:hypothetical protein
MGRVWAAVLSVWALFAVVAVIAWSRPVSGAQPGARTVVVRTANGGQRTIVLAPPPHATTQTSPGSAQQPAVVPGQGPVAASPGAGGGNN